MTGLYAQLEQRILVLDGAMATVLLQPNPPDVDDLHQAYLAAGADIIRTHTFGASSYDHSLVQARRARGAADAVSLVTPDRPRFVAGALGPTMQKTVADIRETYRQRMQGLLDGGIDLLLMETIVDTLHARAAIEAAADEQATRARAIPLMLSITVTDDGRMLSGETIADFAASVAGAPPFSVGINCGTGAWHLHEPLEALGRIGACVSCHPSAGVPNAFGEYDEPPADTARLLGRLAEAGLLNIAGGCCGTAPAYIAAIAAAVRGVAPRQFSNPKTQIPDPKPQIPNPERKRGIAARM